MRIGWLACAAALALVSGCSPDASEESSPTSPTSSAGQRGEIVSAEPATPAADGASRTLVTYRSTSGIDGTGTEVTATVFAPPGSAPAGGWPVVTVGHGTTGVEDDCAPSRSDDLLGSLRLVTPLLDRGYVVAVSDLQGLGTPGPHPYLEPKTAAYNLIDAVRAARHVVADTSTRWAALGLSQGGHASWAAADYAAEYGDGLEFVGAANLSPAADLSPVVGADGSVRLAAAQQVFLPVLLAGLSVSHPELNPDDFLHGALAEDEQLFLTCPPDYAQQRLVRALSFGPEDTQPPSPEAAAQVRQWLTDIALPARAAAGPLLVVTGSLDPVIRPQWTVDAVARACALGDVVAYHERAGERHGDSAAIPEAVAWIADRFAGLPAPDTC